MAKVKNVVKGYETEYGLDEIMIQNQNKKILFWGSLEGFNLTGGLAGEFKKKIKESEVKEKQLFNNNKLYLLIDFEN